MRTTTFPPGYVDDPNDPFRGVLSVAWGREVRRVQGLRPRPLHSLHGPNPTEEQRSSHRARRKAWSSDHRAARKAHDECG